MSTVFFVHVGTFVQGRSCCLLLSTKRTFWIKAWKSYPSGGQVTWDFNLPDCKVVRHGQADGRLFLTLGLNSFISKNGCYDALSRNVQCAYLQIPRRSFHGPNAEPWISCFLLLCEHCGFSARQSLSWQLDDPTQTSSSCEAEAYGLQSSCACAMNRDWYLKDEQKEWIFNHANTQKIMWEC